MARSGRFLRTISTLAFGAMVVALVLWRQIDASMDQRSLAPAGTRIQVNAGTSLRVVLTELAHVRALRNPRLVEWYLRLHHEPVRAQAGVYELPPGATTRELLEQLRAGRVVLSQVIIVEGWTLAQMRQALDGSTDLVHEWSHLDDAALMSALGLKGVAPQGRFFPDTYRFAAGTADRHIYELAAASHDRAVGAGVGRAL